MQVFCQRHFCFLSVSGSDSTKKIALESMDFLISKMFIGDTFKISNKGWFHKGAIAHQYGEQLIEAVI
jgi:hypothetical protein